MVKSGKKLVRGSTSSPANLRAFMRSYEMSTREVKKYTAYNSGGTASTGAVIPITVNIPQGDNISQRTGDQIRVVRFDLAEQVNLNALSTVERVRIVWFIDHYNLGSTPAVTDVLDIANTISSYNYFNDQNNRFKILRDHVHTLCANGKAGVSTNITFKFTKRKLVNFLGTTGAQGQGHFYVLIISDIGSNNGTYTVRWNLRFQDA